MNVEPLKLAGRPLTLHSAVVSPAYEKARVLCNDPWDYVFLWLRRNKQQDALFFWEQAKHFYNATKTLPNVSSPLTSYYSMLNASKALLLSKKRTFTDKHGVSGRSLPGKMSLANEIVSFKGSGVLPSLCRLLGEKDNAGKEYSLSRIFWHLPYIHRAYMLTYSSSTELFIPLKNVGFYRKKKTKECIFIAEVDKRYVNSPTERILPAGYRIHRTDSGIFLMKKKSFMWNKRDKKENSKKLDNYHRGIRKHIVPILASSNRWYLKKNVKYSNEPSNSSIVLTLAAMHRLSELSRYSPTVLSKHLGASYNWLISEFLQVAPSQFVFAIASEITGMEFVRPDTF